MPLLTWSHELSVSVQEFDDQHKKLISMLNQLHEAMGKGQGKAALGPILDGLVRYTASHFAAEERQMQATAYPEFAEHKAEHDRLTAKVREVHTRFQGGQTMLTVELMNFLKAWLTKHIQGTDQKYGPHLNAKGVR